ncbi:MAG: hypothetical protein ACYDDI_10180 [Candidatus Acidiferrales bacterium]
MMAPRHGIVARLDAANPPNFCDSSTLRIFIFSFCLGAIIRANCITVSLAIPAAVLGAFKLPAIVTNSRPAVRSVTGRPTLDRGRS